MMTVGVSIASQKTLYWLMHGVIGNSSELIHKFEERCREDLRINKKILLQVNPEVIEVPRSIEEVPGIFGWFKLGAKANLDKVRIRAVDGKVFGGPGYVRMNMALPKEIVQEVVERLNSL